MNTNSQMKRNGHVGVWTGKVFASKGGGGGGAQKGGGGGGGSRPAPQNAPSTTGKPSGPGRGNNPPAPKR